MRIAADLRAATPYTITLPATLTDRNGIPLGQAYRLRFVTAPSGPALALPEAPAHVAQALPGQPAGLLIRRTNLSALNFDLYQLDEAAVVRTAGFRESDWAQFQPERYGQPLLRSWSVPLADPLNQPVEERVPLATSTGAPLPAGAYYLRIRTPEGPRADLLALISRARLTLQSSAPVSGTAALVWATDIISGTPLAGLPVALYQSGTQIELGTTDANGLASFTRAIGAARPDLVALADGGRFGIVSSAWGNAGLPVARNHTCFLPPTAPPTGRANGSSWPGSCAYTGAPSGTLGLAPAATASRQRARRGAAGRIYQGRLRLGRHRRVQRRPDARLRARRPAPTRSSLPSMAILLRPTFVVQPSGPAPLLVAVQTRQFRAGRRRARTAGGRMSTRPRACRSPARRSRGRWTPSAAPFPMIGDYTFGDAERAPIEDCRAHRQRPDRRRRSLQPGDQRHAGRRSAAALPASARGDRARRAERVGGAGTFVVAPAPIIAGVRLPKPDLRRRQSRE